MLSAESKKRQENLQPMWYDAIKKTVDERKKQCVSHFGKDNIYVPVDKNPYTNSSYDQFYSKNPFKVNSKHCKFQYMPDKTTDEYKRFYKFITTENQCKGYNKPGGLKGIWSDSDINRFNKYDSGNCWVEIDDSRCGNLGNSDLLKPSKVKKMIREGNLEGELDKLKNVCEKDGACMVKGTSKYSYDCVRSDLEEEKKVKNTIPDLPEDFPFDITNKENEADKFLYEWYVKKKYPVPNTSDLIGEGNRCVRQPTKISSAKSDKNEAELENFHNPSKPVGGITFEEFKKIDATVKENQKLMIEYLINNHNMKNSDAEKMVKRLIPNGSNDSSWIRNSRHRIFRLLESTKWDNDKEYPVEDDTKITENDMFGIPTVPQSIVNMLMKNIARNPNGTNRGLLAWFSTGAGKTICATGIMDAFWDTNKQIIFASSLDALASNPPINFYKAALIFPRFQTNQYVGSSKEETLKNIEREFIRRKVRFLSFAKLSNRVEKTIKYKGEIVRYVGGGKKKIVVSDSESESEEEDESTNIEKEVYKGRKKSNNTNYKGKNFKENYKPGKEGKDGKDGKDMARKIKIEEIAKKREKEKKEKEKMKKKDEIKRERGERGDKGVSEDKGDKEPGISEDNYVDLDNCILIIDEVHNLFRPEYNQAKQHKYLENEIADPKKHPRLKTAIMTATPGDNVKDIIKLLNIVRDTKKPPIDEPDTTSEQSMNKFKNDIIGLVSYFNMNADKTKFPVIYEERPLLANMSDKQFNRYKEAYSKDTKADHKNFDKLAASNTTSKYYAPARKYANSLYTYESGMSQVEFSAKLPMVIAKLKLFEKEKHYIYSAFYERRGYGGHGVIGIGKELDKIGYTKLTVAEAVKHNEKGTVPEKKKRYILAIAKELEEARKGKSVGDNLQEILKIYNHPENRNGEIVQIMLASNKFNEGIDLKAVKHIHFFEPLVTMASDKQTVGRAVRNCSHADLDQADWTVKIHRYMINLPTENDVHRSDLSNIEESIKKQEKELSEKKSLYENTSDKAEKRDIKLDIARMTVELKRITVELKKLTKMNNDNVQNVEKKIFEESRSRMKDILTIYQSMREAAIDCKIMEEFHRNSEYPVNCHVFK